MTKKICYDNSYDLKYRILGEKRRLIMGKPIKRYLKINEQVEHLKEEKMQISDEEFAKSILSRVNYYHLSGYWHTLYSENKEFIPGTTFEQVHHLYQFDCELRFLITELLKDLEIKFKAHIANYIGDKWGPLGYRDISNFYDEDTHINFLSILNKKKKQYKKKPFVKHHIDYYDGKLPIWAVVEILSFSDVTSFYRAFHESDRKKLIKKNYTGNWDIINNSTETPNWIKTLCDIRNKCAHYERLYNARLANSIKLPERYSDYNIKTNKLFSALIILTLLVDDENMKLNFIDDLRDLFKKYNFVDIQVMGFPDNWDGILKA